MRWTTSFSAALPAALAAATGIALALDNWDDKIKEYLRNGYHPITAFNTADVTVVYLCHPQGRGWWAYRLSDTTLRQPNLQLAGPTPVHSYNTQGQSHGQGVYFGIEPGAITEGGARPGDRVLPAPATASVVIQARAADGQTRTIALGAIAPQHVAAIRAKCAKAVPRALSPAVLTGRNAR